MNFTICIGDYSGDGHDIRENFRISVPSFVDEDMIARSYAKSVEDFEFSPADVAEGYEESEIAYKHINKLMEAGFSPTPDEENVFADSSSPTGFAWDKTLYDRDVYGLTTALMVEIIMFFVSRNIDNFSWKIIEEPKVLFGGGSIEPHHIGYGLV